MSIDPRVLNSPTFDTPIPARAQGDGTAASNYTAPELVGQGQVLEGSQSIAEAQVVSDRNSRKLATKGETAAAAWDENTLAGLDRYFGTPTYAKDYSYNVGESLQAVQFQLNETDREYLMKSTSQEEFDHRIGNIERYAKNTQVMGDNFWTGMGVAMLDPGYLAVDVMSLGAGRIVAGARAGMAAQRIAAGAVAGVGAAALTAGQDRPVTIKEIALMGMLNGAAGAAFYWPGTRSMRPVDPDFPTVPLTRTAELAAGKVSSKVDDAAEAVAAEVKVGTKVVPENKAAAELRAEFHAGPAVETIPGSESTASAALRAMHASDDPLMSTLSRRMSELLDNDIPMQTAKIERSAYNVARNEIMMHPGADQWTQLHEIAHGMTANRLRYGRAAPDSAIGKLSTQLDTLQQKVQKAADKSKTLTPEQKYYASNTDELMAGLYSGNQGFYDFLRSMPSKNTSMLNRLVDGVRQILGVPKAEQSALTQAMGLTDELMQQPLITRSVVHELDGADSFYTTGLLRSAPADPDDVLRNEDSLVVKAAKGMSWSLHKSMSSFSPKMREIATRLVDDPLDMTGDSVVSQTRAIRADLLPAQIKYEDKLKEVMAKAGAGIRQRIFNPKKAMQTQRGIEQQVAVEMMRRERNAATGRAHTPHADPDITEMANALDAIAKQSLDEMKAAGVRGAEAVEAGSGYFSRRWNIEQIEAIENAVMAGGKSEKAARAHVRDALATGLRRANGWDRELSQDIAGSIIDRARRKGYFEDSAYTGAAGKDDLAEVRDILSNAGISGDRMQRAMDVLNKVTDEEGKASFMKHRVDIDMRAGIAMPDGSYKTVADMIDTNLANITDRYLDNVAGRAALARSGLEDASAVVALRREGLHSIDNEADRAVAADLFDNVIKSVTGQPVGDDMPAFMRASSAATRMVGLASSGLWQATEYAPMMAKYGALKVMRHAMSQLPVLRQLFGEVVKDVNAATDLKSILTRNASADIRMRPFVQRLEDNFEMKPSAHVQLALQQGQQLVPFINAQKMVQTHQARVMANVLTDTLEKAGKGNAKAREIFEQYGLKPDIMDRVGDQLSRHGLDVDKWDDGVWMAARGPLGKAVDEAVLRARTGEIPAFAQFNSAGKFIFTFRSFVLAAHNKVLSGTLARDGLAGLSLALLYQFPMAMMANLANAGIQGKPIKDEKDLIVKSLGQMGSFGLFSELFGIVSGEKQQFGAPGLIFIDRLYKTTGKAAQGEWGQAADSAMSATPILSIIPGIKAIGASLKE